jgi:hypothetical protein
MRARADMPSGHGELTALPPVAEWAELARSNARLADSWQFEVGGRPAGALRAEARRTLLQTASRTTSELGIDAAPVPDDPGPIVVTGHQPDLYHAGVWAKNFLLQRVVRETGGTGVDIVVDSDAFDRVGVTAPCLDPAVKRCLQYLAVGTADSCFACTPVPSADHIEAFCEATASTLAALPAPAIGSHFSRFCDALRAAVPMSGSLADLMVGARRRYEGEITDYLELPVTAAASTRPYLRFAVDVLLDARRFAECYNSELDTYRSLNRVRSVAHPFPNLEIGQDRVEVPFWLLSADGRYPATIEDTGAGVELLGKDVSDGPALLLPHDVEGAIAVLEASGVTLAPRAVTLTLFFRTFLADLFIHGIGGDRYDRVTDGIAQRWWGITLPPYAVASLTMYLPLGAAVVSDEDVAKLDRRLHRLAHNPDEMLGDVTFDSVQERNRALALAEEKRILVADISAEGADRKVLGARIREVNDEMATLIEPLVAEVRARRERLLSQQRDSEVLTDRTYAFCLWSPAEVADKVG